MSFIACCFAGSEPKASKGSGLTPRHVSKGSVLTVPAGGTGPFSGPAPNGATVFGASVNVTEEDGVTSLGEAKRLIAALTERVRTLEGSTTAVESLLHSANTLLPLKSGEALNIRCSSFKGKCVAMLRHVSP